MALLAAVLGSFCVVAVGSMPANAATGTLNFYWNIDGKLSWNPTPMSGTASSTPAIVRSGGSTEIAADA